MYQSRIVLFLILFSNGGELPLFQQYNNLVIVLSGLPISHALLHMGVLFWWGDYQVRAHLCNCHSLAHCSCPIFGTNPCHLCYPKLHYQCNIYPKLVTVFDHHDNLPKIPLWIYPFWQLNVERNIYKSGSSRLQERLTMKGKNKQKHLFWGLFSFMSCRFQTKPTRCYNCFFLFELFMTRTLYHQITFLRKPWNDTIKNKIYLLYTSWYYLLYMR